MENETSQKQAGDGLVQMSADAVFHFDILKVALPKGFASDVSSDATAKKQMSLDLDDMW